MRPPTRVTKFSPPRLPGMGSHPTKLWHGCRYRPEKGAFSYVTDPTGTMAIARDDEAAERIARALNLLDADEKTLGEVLRIGQLMSNVCFNMSQHARGVADQRDLTRLRELQLEWDAALRKLKEARGG